MPDLSGQSIGRYHLIEQLGEGGMAIVYKAYDTRLEREVAVKIIRRSAFSPEMMEGVLKRFEREAKSLARLSHPNIVKVHDFGEHEGAPFLVLEYLPGGTLKEKLGKPIAWPKAIKLLLPIARGIAYAHQRGIIHRDIKPANILITESGEPMLSDFGIAKILEMGQTTALTGTGMAIGTPEYMAPEQWAGKTGLQSDQYSFGVVLYEMLTGRKPYIADTPAAIFLKQATEPLPRPSQLALDLPESAEWVLIKALAKDPVDRYADMNAMMDAMESLLLDAPALHAPPAPITLPEKSIVEQEHPTRPTPTETEIQAGSRTVSPPIAPAVQRPSGQKVDAQAGRNSSQNRGKRSLGLLPKGIIAIVAIIVLISLGAIGFPLTQQWFAAATRITQAATAAKTVTFAPTSTFTVLPSTATPQLAACAPKCAYKDMVVGFIQTGPEGAWRAANNASFLEYANQKGITMKVYDAQGRVENQISAFKTFNQDPTVNIIILAANDANGFDDVLKDARAAGKLVVLEDRKINTSPDLYYTRIGSDFVAEGQKGAMAMCDLLKNSAKKNVVEISGTTGSDSSMERARGFRDKMGDCGITVSASQSGNWTVADSKAVVEVWLKDATLKDFQGVFAHNDEEALGAIQAIKKAGLKPGVDIKIVGVDATKAGFGALISGELNADIECNPLIGPQVLEAALQGLNGDTAMPKYVPSNEGQFFATQGAEALKALLPTRKY